MTDSPAQRKQDANKADFVLVCFGFGFLAWAAHDSCKSFSLLCRGRRSTSRRKINTSQIVPPKISFHHKVFFIFPFLDATTCLFHLSASTLTYSLNIFSLNNLSVQAVQCIRPSWPDPVLILRVSLQPSDMKLWVLFHSLFPWQLSLRDRRGFSRRQSTAAESLFTAGLKLIFTDALLQYHPRTPSISTPHITTQGYCT